MDISRFGKLITLLGVLIIAFGALKYFTNLDEKFDSSKSPPSIFGGRNDLGEALRVQEANMRHGYEREQATPYFIGGAIVAFVGFALSASGKKSETTSPTTRTSNNTRTKEAAKSVTADEPLRFCYHCGEELNEESSNCPKCGKSLA